MEEDLSRQFGQLTTDERLSHIEMPLDDGNNNDFGELGGSENCNLIVNYLPHDIDDSGLRDLFSPYGEIVMTKVVRDKNTKKSLGYGFVKFLKEDEAVFAIDKMNGFTIGHKNLKVSVARPPSLEIRNCKLYVTNLPKDYTEREVVTLFKEFGDIIECRVLKDKNARANKGVAFVQFNLKAQANNALSLNGCQLEGSTRGLVVKYAEDQHKKKELTRLQSLTSPNGNPMGTNNNINSFNHHNNNNNSVFSRSMMMGGGGHMNGPMGMNGGSHMNNGGNSNNGGGMMHNMGGGGGLGGMGSSLNNPKGLRIDSKSDLLQSQHHHQQQQQQLPQQQQQAYYYQQQQGIPTMYGGLGSPMMSPLNSPQLSIYVPSVGAPSMLDYSPSDRRPLKGRKGFILDNHSPQHQQQQQQQQNWFNSMPPHMSYMQSPGISLPQHSPVGLTAVQNQHIQQTMAMLSSPPSTHHRRFDDSPPNQQQQQQPSPTYSQHSPSGSQYSGSVMLSISNLPAHADVAMLHELFSPYGRILSAQIDVDQSSQSRLSSTAAGRVSVCSGRGRVQMAGLPQGEFAAHALNGAIVCEGGLPIQVQMSF